MGGEEPEGTGVKCNAQREPVHRISSMGKSVPLVWLSSRADRVFGIFLALSFVCSGCRSVRPRPRNVPSSAVLVNGVFIDCGVDEARDEDRCTVYKDITGDILADGLFGVGEPPAAVKKNELQYAGFGSDPLGSYILLSDSRLLSLRQASDRDPTNQIIEKTLKSFSSSTEENAVNCGKTDMKNPDVNVSECAQAAFQNGNPFYVRYFAAGMIRYFSYGLAGDVNRNVFEVTYETRGFPEVVLGKNERLLDDNHVRVMTCIKPVALGKTEEGMLACVTPINEEESAAAAQQRTIDTTVCAIVANPAAFNNRMVRVRGHFSGNFEYSELSGDGCAGSIWFAYGDAGGPPSLTAYIAGGSEPGALDSEGRRILPVPVQLIRDANFRRFERLIQVAARLDAWPQETDPKRFEFHKVTATFVGRVDGVSPDIHAFHLKRKPTDNVDYLGFGQMGLFDAQFVLQSVEGHARLERHASDPGQ